MSIYRTRSSFLALFFFLWSLSPLWGQAATRTKSDAPETHGAEGLIVLTSEEKARMLHQRLEELARELQRQLERVAHERDPNSAKRLEDEARSLRGHLEELEREILKRSPEDSESLLGKLRALEGMAGNLERATTGKNPKSARSPSVRPPIRVHSTPVEGAAPTNDLCLAARPIDLGDLETGHTSNATQDGVASCGSSIFSPDVWFEFTAQASGYLSLDTIGSSFDTVISVHAGCPGNPGNEIVCNDDAAGVQSATRFYARAGETYLIRLSGYHQSSGAYTLRLGEGGEISGTVTESGTGNPLPDGRVEVYNSRGSYSYSATTGPDGEYSILGVRPGDYFLRTDDFSEHFEELYQDLPCASGCSVTSGTPLTVSSIGSVTGVDFSLDRGAEIRGVVTHAATGDPAEEVRVEIYDTAGDFVGSDWTDATGAYAVGGLVTGSYFAFAESSGYRNEIYDDLPCPGDAPYGCDPTTGAPLDVVVPSTLAGVDFALDRYGVVTGTVRSANTGDPIPWVNVEIRRSSDGAALGSGYTDESGVYSVGGLPPGTYVALVGDYDYPGTMHPDVLCAGQAPAGCDFSSATPLVIEFEVTLSGIDISLQDLGSVSGTVRDSVTGDPISNVRVTVFSDEGYFVESDYSDSSGEYVASGLRAGTYFARADGFFFEDYHNELFEELPCAISCEVTTGTPIAVALNATTQNVDFTLDPGGVISGVVSEAATGEGIDYASISVWNEDGTHVRDAESDSSGNYAVGGLVSGVFFVTVDKSAFQSEVYNDLPCGPAGCEPTTGVPVAVTLNQETTHIDFALTRLGSITGTVTEQATGDPISARVTIWDESGSSVGSDSTGSSGIFTIQGLHPGKYFATASEYGYLRELYLEIPCADCDVTTGAAIAVSSESTVGGIDFTLEPLGRLSGTVTFADTGLPLEGAHVELWSATGARIDYEYSLSDGGYDFDNLPPGNYFLVVENPYSEPGLFVDQLYDSIPCPGGAPEGCDPTTGTSIPVMLNHRSIADVAVDRSGGITGLVTDGAGNPLKGVRVELYQEGDEYRQRSVETDAAGVYEMENLQPGVYFLVTDNPQGFLDEIFDGVPCPGDAGNCDATKGTEVVVAAVAMTQADFSLEHFGSIRGKVLDAIYGSAMANVTVNAWNEAGHYLASSTTDAAGEYQLALGAGAFYLSIEGVPGFHDEVYGAGPCDGGCVPSAGTVVLVGVDGGDPVATGIDFSLDPKIAFRDDFESGGLSSWSIQVGGPQ